jgi:TRAP-type C4-dicarboxylate transport system permease small subunit
MSNDHKTPRLKPNWLRLFDKGLTRVALFGGALTLAFMTGLTFWNVVVMRKILNAPMLGAEDILVLALVVVVAVAVPFGSRTGAHIEIELLEPRMSAGFARWSLFAVKLLGAAVLFVAARQLWHAGQSAEKFGETTQQLLISFEPFYYLLSVAMLVYGIVLIMDLWQLARTGRVSTLDAESEAP